jgi:hypothetical protein
MAHTYEQLNGVSPEKAMQRMERDRKRKPALAIGALIAGLAAVAAAAYFSYRDVPAPANPAHAGTEVLAPYR